MHRRHPNGVQVRVVHTSPVVHWVPWEADHPNQWLCACNPDPELDGIDDEFAYGQVRLEGPNFSSVRRAVTCVKCLAEIVKYSVKRNQ